jgi:hypothetical protein
MLALIAYDSIEGGSHEALLGAGSGHYTFGFEAKRTWKDWKQTFSPIGLAGIEIPGASREFGKKISVQKWEFGGLFQYENGHLSVGLYGGFTLGKGRTFGAGSYFTLSWSGCK